MKEKPWEWVWNKKWSLAGLFENGEAEVRQSAGGCMATREKWRMFFIFELGPYVEMA